MGDVAYRTKQARSNILIIFLAIAVFLEAETNADRKGKEICFKKTDKPFAITI